MGPDGKRGLPKLERVVKEEDESLKKLAADAIDKVNGKRKTEAEIRERRAS
jgi:hypothetical protein